MVISNTVMLVYNEKEQVGQRKYKIYSLRRKDSPGNLMV